MEHPKGQTMNATTPAFDVPRLLAAIAAATLVMSLAVVASAAPPAEAPGRGLDGDPATTEGVDSSDPATAALEISRLRFDDARPARHVVLSRDDTFPDSLTGASLTGEGPLLLTPSAGLDAAVAAEIDRVLDPGDRVYLLGGETALSAGIEGSLDADGYDVVRLAGASRVETAVAVADEVVSLYQSSEVLIARAYPAGGDETSGWADSVSGGAVAAAAGVPILVTPTDEIHPAVSDWLTRYYPYRIMLLGGTAALSEDVEYGFTELRLGVPERIAGPERTATAAAVATGIWGAATSGPRSALVVNGARSDGWAFGLAAAGLAADERAPVLLVTSAVTPAIEPLVSACGAAEVDLFVVGDESVVSTAVRDRLHNLDGDGCAQAGTSTRSSALEPFDSCEALVGHYQDLALDDVGPFGLGGFYGYPDVAASEGEMAGGSDTGTTPAPASPPGGETSGGGFSGTNNQEEGVDEPDFVKTDGRVALALAAGQIQIIDLTGAEPRLASTLSPPSDEFSAYSSQLLLDGATAVVISNRVDFGAPAEEGSPEPADSAPGRLGLATELTFLDVSDPDQPLEQATLVLDGEYRSARLVGGVMRLVVHTGPGDLGMVYPSDASAEAVQEADEHNTQAVLDATAEDWLPGYSLTESGEDQVVTEGPLVDCADVAQPPADSGLGTLSVVTVPLDGTFAPSSSAAVVAQGETVYASTDRLYVTTSRWEEVPPVPEVWLPLRTGAIATEIHGFDITDAAATRYVGSGQVDGSVLNQFSLSEHQGYLRVATTEFPRWGFEVETELPESESGVTILEERGGGLTQVGRVGGLGVGERIYAVRFLGDVGTVVTFRQVDPLYVLDLADPTAPRVAGELKIPGFSSYLHRVGENQLLGVGQDANDQGQTTGVQVSLFDISDRANPRRVDQLLFGDGYSAVEYDHRAFLYWAPTGLAVIPLEAYQQESTATSAVGLTVTPDDLSEAGRLSHERPEDDYFSPIGRSFVVGDSLFTLSERGLMQSDLETFAEEAFVEFPPHPSQGDVSEGSTEASPPPQEDPAGS